ncbi:hypothetical protein AB833_05750 [Chromatiales bacterium (ex Bugula neritina AB1)]|nr:hypothetical protein AB833_05750 [Chromatiales bacterium (ex Bugula neritina AB1)]
MWMISVFRDRKLWLLGITLVFCFLLNGCASAYRPQPDSEGVIRSSPQRPKVGEAREMLRALPAPSGRINAAVYGFGDLTGQNKPSPASGLSTAVTQGAASSLISLMLESGWFRPVERVGLQSILSERNLWEQRLRAQQRSGLEPLPPASIIFEGGVVAYEFNTRTGGYGAKYLGIGGSKEYREDVLTISLRAINAQSGVVLSSVTSTKRIYSKSVNSGIFGFVDTDRLLEVEGGWASNESVQVGLEEAIAFALIDLIADGLKTGTWQLQNPEDIQSNTFAKFLTQEDVETYIGHSLTEPVDEGQQLRQSGANQVSEPKGEPTAAVGEADLSVDTKDSDTVGGGVGPGDRDGGAAVSWMEIPFDESDEVSRARVAPSGHPEPPSSRQSEDNLTKNEVKPAPAVDSQKQEASEEPEEIEPAIKKPNSAAIAKYIVVGYSKEPTQMIDFQRWLDDRYDGVDVAVIRSKDSVAYQVAIGPFDSEVDVGLVGKDLQSQGIPLAELLEVLHSSRVLRIVENSDPGGE